MAAQKMTFEQFVVEYFPFDVFLDELADDDVEFLRTQYDRLFGQETNNTKKEDEEEW